MEVVLCLFLWQGGKNDNTKFNLVSWKQVIHALDRGGLGIRSPTFSNLSFGGKIVWRLITDPLAWWKQVLETKYLNSPRQKILNSDIPNRDSSKIGRLCKKAIPFMTQNISKVPRGGASINIGADKILGQQSINRHDEAIPILTFLNNMGIFYLDQISRWDPLSHLWIGWSFPAIPNDLNLSLSALQPLLHSKAPIKKNEKDGFRWDPSGSDYSIQAGHQHICYSTYPMTLWNHWRIVWESEALPKIKFFTWALLKGKILTTENLQKRGINGPSCCPNCCGAKETMHHLFVHCSFAVDCWKKLSLTDKLPWTAYVEERGFISYILDKNNNIQKGNKGKDQHSQETHSWKIRLREEEFANWLQNCNSYYLFFDGASKSNPGIAGAGGLILNANGECVLYYEWRLGNLSYSRAEALALYQGLTQLNRLGIRTTNIFGDSSVVISLMIQQKDSPNILLQQVIQRCQFLNQTLGNLQYHHILRNLNKHADSHANKACERAIGSLCCNTEESHQPLP
eukprot:PITA_19461